MVVPQVRLTFDGMRAQLNGGEAGQRTEKQSKAMLAEF